MWNKLLGQDNIIFLVPYGNNAHPIAGHTLFIPWGVVSLSLLLVETGWFHKLDDISSVVFFMVSAISGSLKIV